MTANQQRIVDYLSKFLHAADGKHLSKCLQFVTGVSYIPPMGFDDFITLECTEEKRLPLARTCTLQLQLSVVCPSYEDVECEMKLSVMEQRFYCV